MADATSTSKHHLSSVAAVSNAQSLAESKASQLDVKIKANQTKLKLRQLLKNVDQEKTGKVRDSVFF